MPTIYIISGPAGAGKSTLSKKLVSSLPKSARIEGDTVNHMVAGGYLPPWKSPALLELTWRNIADLTVNFIGQRMDVVIDYVAFPDEVKRFKKQVENRVQCRIKYVVLQVDRDELIRRDESRPEEYRMGPRSVELLEQFNRSGVKDCFVLNTTTFHLGELEKLEEIIRREERFFL
ncbi:AAA family ATPase [Jeotgalibacillus proteolyticus]|uniref:Gluconokinase n=1 Tax=Jeotgalibacillus proteolyticus TaxID=2082395 RepID=A0A2S5GDA9_9BACL|nr:AAA family ATPase [Jeotgalibacillus proteolyticus]PPA70894.1 hypothetical protein C4B60_08900 [Jeotgalibacillus proteolyticus]